MKKLLRHIALYLLPVFIFLVLLPVDKQLKYKGLKDDCFNHGAWIYNRIYENDKSIDIAFLGSSHTINAIDDKLIEDSLKPLTVANFGYCRLGRNLSYILLKEIHSKKKIKHMIVEIREEENRYSHPIFPYLANSRDVILANPFFNKDYLKDIWTHLMYKIELAQEKIYQSNKYTLQKYNHFGHNTFNDTVSFELLEKIKKKRSKPKKQLSDFEYNFHATFARIYLQRIINYCNENKIKITFLYLPGFGREQMKPCELSTYQEYGDVLFPPAEILRNPNHWHDENHLNNAGATKLSQWVAKQLQ